MLSNAPDLSSFAPVRRWLGRILLVLGVLFVLVMLLRPRTPSAAEQAAVPAGWPNNQRPSLKQRLQRSVPMWAWRLRDRFRTPPRQVLIESAFLSFTKPFPADALPRSALALADTNGLRIWIVSSNDWRATGERLPKSTGAYANYRPRLQTAHGMSAILFTGTSNANLTIQHWPLVHGDILDLTTIFSLVEPSPPHTDGPFAARLQIPAGHRALFLCEPCLGDTRPPIALLLTPTLLPKK
jgi:hypothetical protein